MCNNKEPVDPVQATTLSVDERAELEQENAMLKAELFEARSEVSRLMQVIYPKEAE